MIRTRFAPSPTGSLHVGNARIAVINWLLTRRHGGTFVLRIEDTDLDRNQAGSEEMIFRDLRWLGLDWDEGPSFEGRPADGGHGPYRQSERAALHSDAARQLLERGLVYECFCSDSELATMRERAIANGDPVGYDGRCSRLSAGELATRRTANEPPALRFRVAGSSDVVVEDAIRGEVRFAAAELSDFVILRADGRPTYNFAVVVDDIGMAITHVIRGSGHLSNTPRQALLYQAFGAAAPVFAHIPTVLGPDRQKLSKRHGAPSLQDYRRDGYHPDAIVNYLSLLSWSSESGDEILDRQRLISETTLDRIGASNVVFDPDKLRWLSAKHIERMPIERLIEAVRPHLGVWGDQVPAALLADAVTAVRTHLVTFSAIDDELAALFPPADDRMPDLDPSASPVIEAAIAVFDELPEWSADELDAALRTVGQRSGARGKGLYIPIRQALTAREHGPPLKAVLEIQGRATVLRRLRLAGTERQGDRTTGSAAGGQ